MSDSCNIFSNESSELLDYLEEDHRFSTKTYSYLDFCGQDIDVKKETKPLPETRQSIIITEPGSNEEILIEIPQHTILSKRSVRGSRVPLPQIPTQQNSSPRHSMDVRDIKVCDPITETKNLKTYTTYLIKYGTVEVRRRYSEFGKLVEKLKKEFVGKDFPSLPEKQYFGRFDQELIQGRVQGMTEFLKFCINDVDIKAFKDFLLFIQK